MCVCASVWSGVPSRISDSRDCTALTNEQLGHLPNGEAATAEESKALQHIHRHIPHLIIIKICNRNKAQIPMRYYHHTHTHIYLVAILRIQVLAPQSR